MEEEFEKGDQAAWNEALAKYLNSGTRGEHMATTPRHSRGAAVKKLVGTIGLPKSGKTTWARKQGHPIVNPDSIRLALHDHDYIRLAEPFVWAIAKVMVRALFEAGHEVVILDATNTTEKRREEWMSDEWETEWHIIATPKSVCLERADETMKPVIERMAGAWDLSAHDVNL